MDEKTRILLIGGGLIALVLIGGVGALALFAGNTEFLDRGVLVECSGEVEVDFLGIGNPELDPSPKCEAVKKCPNGFSLADFFLPSVESGDVVMYIDGEARDDFAWSSVTGGNVPFTLSACTATASEIRVDLYNEDGAVVDTYRKQVSV